MRKKTLAGLGIGRTKPAFIIAEAGINHNGRVDVALRMIDAAKEAGANAIKFQTYVTEKRVKKNSPVFDILKECELSEADLKRLKHHADRKKILLFSTPFDEESVETLVALQIPLIKIASFDVVNHRLLAKVASTGLPVIMSRGMASKKELSAAISIFWRRKSDVAVLHCVSAYPTEKKDVNLTAIRTLISTYPVPIGYSDHTLDIDACVYAIVMGARILEKHFTLDRKMKGPDHALSADQKDFTLLVKRVREAEAMLGSGKIEMLPAEKSTKVFRRPSRI